MPRERSVARALGAFLLAFLAAPVLAGDWLEIDYAPLVDRRQISHSGESVGMLLDKLGGRPVPPAGERPADRLAHSLLEPLVEPYAFVLADALDLLEGVADPPLVEIGGLWSPGEPQPAWVELLRARRYLVESDGRGTLRLALPLEAGGSVSGAAAAEAAWAEAWPVLRHILAAERRRLDAGGSKATPLRVRVYPYRHEPARSAFALGATPWSAEIDDLRPDGLRPPLDLAAWKSFLDQGLQIEGARIDEAGAIRLLGSPGAAPTLAGTPIGLGDLAVAYRAVVHGGLAEPYMSLDRGYSPQTAIVNYGGRLRDTALGMVSLLCDIRFKTFSLGLDIMTGQDLRPTIRDGVPGFGSHMERFARHPASADVTSQQTRLWFYPDRVDLTVSAQNDALVMRRVRMSAASERVVGEEGEATSGGEPPWTTETVRAINGDYDALARFFPELAELDQAVRLLSLFTWLRQAGEAGLLLPDLDALLAVELPALPTPRVFPQLLAFNALPAPGGGGDVLVFDRVPVAEALDRLDPAGGPLDARRRLGRAVGALDPADPQSAALLAEYSRVDLAGLDPGLIDVMAYRAERLRMHHTVLATLGAAETREVTDRQQAGEATRVFSVGIGGLDLGMNQVVARAAGRSLSLSGLGAGVAAAAVAGQGAVADARPSEPREAWRADPPLVAAASMRGHGSAKAGARVSFGDGWVESGSEAGVDRIWTVYGAHDPELRSRKVFLGEGRRPRSFERVEGWRRWRYAIERKGDTLRVVTESDPAVAAGAWETRTARPLPEGLVTLGIGPAAEPMPSPVSGEPQKLGLRIVALPAGTPRVLEADLPRAVLARLAAGRAADLTPGRPLPALSPLPPGLGQVDALMLTLDAATRARPWEPDWRRLPGEEDPRRLAGSLREWWAAEDGTAGVAVGVDADESPNRWALAGSRKLTPAVLVLPPEGFTGPLAPLRKELAAAWTAGPVLDRVPEGGDAALILLVSGEAPGPLGARVATAARTPGLAGRLLAVWSLSGPLRADVPAWVMTDGALGGLGVGESGVVALRGAAATLAAIDAALAAGDGPQRVERLPGPFVWYF